MITRIIHEGLPQVLDLLGSTREVCTLNHVGETLKGDRSQDDHDRHSHEQLQQSEACCRLSVAPPVHGFLVVKAPLGRCQDHAIVP